MLPATTISSVWRRSCCCKLIPAQKVGSVLKIFKFHKIIKIKIKLKFSANYDSDCSFLCKIVTILIKTPLLKYWHFLWVTVIFCKFVHFVKFGSLAFHPLAFMIRLFLCSYLFEFILIYVNNYQYNKTALDWAKERGRKEIAALLGKQKYLLHH